MTGTPSTKGLQCTYGNEHYLFATKTQEEMSLLQNCLSSERLVIGGKGLDKDGTIYPMVRAI
jgi:hypothetical protein